MSTTESVKNWFNKSLESIKAILFFIGLIWGMHFLSFIIPLQKYGVIPRVFPRGLFGILLGPLVHANFGHLLANSVGLLSFGPLIALFESKHFYKVFFVVYFLHGLLIWCFARGGSHIGASGLIFGLFGYLLSIGFFKKRIKYIFISAMVLIGYGGMITGVLPTGSHVSWEGHLFGLLSGVLMAKLLP
jgi:membrane associated rhomboid family serine protease